MELAPYKQQFFRTLFDGVGRWVNEPTLLALIDDGVAQMVDKSIEGDRYPRAMCDAFPVPGATPDDYRIHEVAVFDDLAVLAEVRFPTRAVQPCFVNVAAQTRAIHPDEIPQILPTLGRRFARFSPGQTRFFFPAELDISQLAARAGDRLVVGSLPHLLVPTRPTSLDPSIQLRAAEDFCWLPEYRALYHQFLDEVPRWRGVLRPKSQWALESSLAQGGLRMIEHEGRFAGIIAAALQQERCLYGWEMMEFLLAPSLRGRGFAATIEIEFLRTLDQSRAQLVLGLIEADNRPSLKTALRVGRKDLGGWHFVGLKPDT